MASDTTAKNWGDRFFRWGPYALLGLATLLATLTADMFLMTLGEKYATGSLIVAALVLHLWWNRTGPGLPEYHAVGRAYYVIRFALGFALTWLNPFFSVYAVLGYFDVGMLPRRQMYAGMFATAVTMAGSQSGGLLPTSGLQWVAFGALFALNVGLTFVFADVSLKEAKVAKAKAATIAELELANSRLEQALEENAGLHAQLLVQAREAGVNDERRRMAAEIHDTIAQGLAGIITQLQAAVDSADPAASHAHVERAADLARHSLGRPAARSRTSAPARWSTTPFPTPSRTSSRRGRPRWAYGPSSPSPAPSSRCTTRSRPPCSVSPRRPSPTPVGTPAPRGSASPSRTWTTR